MSDEERVPEPFLDDERTDVLFVTEAGRATRKPQDCCTLTLLTGIGAGMVHVIDGDETVLGRGHGCRVRIEDTALSRRHCRIVRRGAEYLVEDMGSTNGTLVDGQPVEGSRPLEDGARIQMGRDTVLKFSRQDKLEAEASRRLYESAMNDPLTGVHNRRYLDEHLSSEFAFAARHGSSLSLVILDADHFKNINDTWGHSAGDAVLRAVAIRLQQSVRTEDLVARFGGEEFAVLVRGISDQGALALAERIRHAVSAVPVEVQGQPIPVTVSLGVVTMAPGRPFASAVTLLEAADEALYRAKEAGRNRAERG